MGESKKFWPDKDWYIKNLTDIQKDVIRLDREIKGELDVYAWDEYSPKFGKIINGLEVIINVMNGKK